jgi:cell wall-associated NlpC family hydrolase
MVDISDYWLYTLFKVTFDQAQPSEPDSGDEEPTSTEATTDTEAEPALLVGTINDAPVSLHNGPGTLYAEIGMAQPETKVTLLAYYEDWYQIELEDGAVGWVFADLLTISPAIQARVPMAEHVPPAPSGVRPSGDVASYAIQYVGYPYVYGGTTPHGFDCSGFVQYVYAQHGVYLPRTAAQQYSTAHGVVVERMHELAPGDLMFFVNTSTPGISHVAIYIGDGRMVHAMSYSVGVGVSNIWDTYWVSHYYVAIRVRR